MDSFAHTPAPPYYAVIFTSLRTEGDQGYGATAERMVELAAQQPGFLGVESAREGLGITVSYWADLASIAAWKRMPSTSTRSAWAGRSGTRASRRALPAWSATTACSARGAAAAAIAA